MKKNYSVLVVTTFRKWYTIEADSPEEAKEEVLKYDDTIDTDNFETEAEVWED